MAHRTFRDELGVIWQAWDVRPALAERRLVERRSGASEPQLRERREGERRSIAEPRVRISTELCHGWVTFESDSERRRLAPAPEGWEGAPEGALRRLLSAAKPVAAGRKRLIE